MARQKLRLSTQKPPQAVPSVPNKHLNTHWSLVAPISAVLCHCERHRHRVRAEDLPGTFPARSGTFSGHGIFSVSRAETCTAELLQQHKGFYSSTRAPADCREVSNPCLSAGHEMGVFRRGLKNDAKMYSSRLSGGSKEPNPTPSHDIRAIT